MASRKASASERRLCSGGNVAPDQISDRWIIYPLCRSQDCDCRAVAFETVQAYYKQNPPKYVPAVMLRPRITKILVECKINSPDELQAAEVLAPYVDKNRRERVAHWRKGVYICVLNRKDELEQEIRDKLAALGIEATVSSEEVKA